jgi:Predicted nucleic-acid-binding protein containing a Zn-ribbon
MCYSYDTEWIVASGRGKVYTFAVYHQVYHESFRNDIPYVTAVIELEEGPHILSNIVGCSIDQVRCDMPVEVVWEDVTEEFSLPKFRPVS